MKKNLFTFTFLIFCVVTACAQQTPFLQWQKCYGGKNYDFAKSIIQTTDGGFVTAGASWSTDGDVTINHGYSDFWIVKCDASGKIQWQKSYGGSSYDEANCILQTSDGGYIVAGNTGSDDGDVTDHRGGVGVDDYWVIKLNADGNLQWQKTYGGRYDDEANGITQTTDGGYVIAGTTFSSNGDAVGNHGLLDFCIIKINSTGDREWAKTFGGSYSEWANSVVQTSDGGCIVAGSAASNDGDVVGNHGPSPFEDYWVIKLDNTGNVQWKKCYGGSSIDEANCIRNTQDGGYVIAGETFSYDGDVTNNNGFVDFWIVKINSSGNIQWQKALGGTNVEEATSVWQNKDGSYIAAGTSLSSNGELEFNRGKNDYWVTKLSSAGDLQWQKDIGGSFDDDPSSVLQTPDDGFIVAGETRSTDGNVSGRHFNNNRVDEWVVKLSPEIFDDLVHIHPFGVKSYCSSLNSISCYISNRAFYDIRLYRFGVLYDSIIHYYSATGTSFRNVPPGAYYVIVTDENGKTSFSKQISIVPPPYNLSVTSLTSTSAQLKWTVLYCADEYALQFKKQSADKWIEKAPGNTSAFILDSLDPSTTYTWRIASEKRINGIKATGEFSDSVTFTTASSIVSSANNASASALNSTQLSISPNPAKNSFKIFFNTTSANKINAMLYDVNGKAVWSSGSMNASLLNNKIVSITAFAKGVYYLKLIEENRKLVSAVKVIITN